MVRLEWADIEAFDGEAEPALHPGDLNGSSVPRPPLAGSTLRATSRAPLSGGRLGNRSSRDDESADFASNALTENRKSVKVRAVAALEPKQIFVVVHRIDFSVYFRRIEREEFALLSALRGGKTIERAIELAFQQSSIPEFDRGGYVRHCFQTWATLGWFCRPGRNICAVRKPRENE